MSPASSHAKFVAPADASSSRTSRCILPLNTRSCRVDESSFWLSPSGTARGVGAFVKLNMLRPSKKPEVARGEQLVRTLDEIWRDMSERNQIAMWDQMLLTTGCPN
eukprot:325972-Pleurochrysis_carterae.AAC.2